MEVINEGLWLYENEEEWCKYQLQDCQELQFKS